MQYLQLHSMNINMFAKPHALRLCISYQPRSILKLMQDLFCCCLVTNFTQRVALAYQIAQQDELLYSIAFITFLHIYNVFANYVGGLQLRVVQNAAHPFLHRHFPRFPHELAHSYHTRHPHAAHQHDEDPPDVGEAEGVGGAARLRRLILKQQ